MTYSRAPAHHFVPQDHQSRVEKESLDTDLDAGETWQDISRAAWSRTDTHASANPDINKQNLSEQADTGETWQDISRAAWTRTDMHASAMPDITRQNLNEMQGLNFDPKRREAVPLGGLANFEGSGSSKGLIDWNALSRGETVVINPLPARQMTGLNPGNVGMRSERGDERSPTLAPREAIGGRVLREASDRTRFYAAQNDGVSCAAFSMAMMAGDHILGRPPQYGSEAQRFKALAGTLNQGYRGSLQTMAGQLRSVGLEAKAYQYNRFGQQGLKDLNAELDQGHGAVGRVINPHTGNRHYIYIAGRTSEGNYVLGDPDRANRSHAQPVSPERLVKMMSGRDGFVAGWASSDSPASSIPGTAAYRLSMARNRSSLRVARASLP